MDSSVEYYPNVYAMSIPRTTAVQATPPAAGLAADGDPTMFLEMPQIISRGKKNEKKKERKEKANGRFLELAF